MDTLAFLQEEDQNDSLSSLCLNYILLDQPELAKGILFVLKDRSPQRAKDILCTVVTEGPSLFKQWVSKRSILKTYLFYCNLLKEFFPEININETVLYQIQVKLVASILMNEIPSSERIETLMILFEKQDYANFFGSLFAIVNVEEKGELFRVLLHLIQEHDTDIFQDILTTIIQQQITKRRFPEVFLLFEFYDFKANSVMCTTFMKDIYQTLQGSKDIDHKTRLLTAAARGIPRDNFLWFCQNEVHFEEKVIKESGSERSNTLSETFLLSWMQEEHVESSLIKKSILNLQSIEQSSEEEIDVSKILPDFALLRQHKALCFLLLWCSATKDGSKIQLVKYFSAAEREFTEPLKGWCTKIINQTKIACWIAAAINAVSNKEDLLPSFSRTDQFSGSLSIRASETIVDTESSTEGSKTEQKYAQPEMDVFQIDKPSMDMYSFSFNKIHAEQEPAVQVLFEALRKFRGESWKQDVQLLQSTGRLNNLVDILSSSNYGLSKDALLILIPLLLIGRKNGSGTLLKELAATFAAIPEQDIKELALSLLFVMAVFGEEIDVSLDQYEELFSMLKENSTESHPLSRCVDAALRRVKIMKRLRTSLSDSNIDHKYLFCSDAAILNLLLVNGVEDEETLYLLPTAQRDTLKALRSFEEKSRQFAETGLQTEFSGIEELKLHASALLMAKDKNEFFAEDLANWRNSDDKGANQFLTFLDMFYEKGVPLTTSLFSLDKQEAITLGNASDGSSVLKRCTENKVINEALEKLKTLSSPQDLEGLKEQHIGGLLGRFVEQLCKISETASEASVPFSLSNISSFSVTVFIYMLLREGQVASAEKLSKALHLNIYHLIVFSLAGRPFHNASGETLLAQLSPNVLQFFQQRYPLTANVLTYFRLLCDQQLPIELPSFPSEHTNRTLPMNFQQLLDQVLSLPLKLWMNARLSLVDRILRVTEGASIECRQQIRDQIKRIDEDPEAIEHVLQTILSSNDKDLICRAHNVFYHSHNPVPDCALLVFIERAATSADVAKHVLAMTHPSLALEHIFAWESTWDLETVTTVLQLAAEDVALLRERDECALPEGQEARLRNEVERVKFINEVLSSCDKWRSWQEVSDLITQRPSEIIRALIQSGNFALSRRFRQMFSAAGEQTTIEEECILSMVLSDDRQNAMLLLVELQPSDAFKVAVSVLERLKRVVGRPFEERAKATLFVVNFISTSMSEFVDEGLRRRLDGILRGVNAVTCLPDDLQPLYERLIERPELIVESLVMAVRLQHLESIFRVAPQLRDDSVLLRFARRALTLSPGEYTPMSAPLTGDPADDEEKRGAFAFPGAPNFDVAKTLFDLCEDKDAVCTTCLSVCDGYMDPFSEDPEHVPLRDVIRYCKQLLTTLHTQTAIENRAKIDVLEAHVDLFLELHAKELGFKMKLRDFSNPSKARYYRDQLLKKGSIADVFHLSTVLGIGIARTINQVVLELIAQNNFAEARARVDKCLHAPSQSLVDAITPLELVTKIVEELEKSPVATVDSQHAILSGLRKAATGAFTPGDVSAYLQAVKERQTVKPFEGSERMHEAIYYLKRYGNDISLLKFLLKYNLYEEVLRTVVERKVSSSLFLDPVFLHFVTHNKYQRFKREVLAFDPEFKQFKDHLMFCCSYLAEKRAYTLLLDMQLFLKDYVRAGITMLSLFTAEKEDIGKKIGFLNKAKEYFEFAINTPDPQFSIGDITKLIGECQIQLSILNSLNKKAFPGVFLRKSLFDGKEAEFELTEAILLQNNSSLAAQIITLCNIDITELYPKVCATLIGDSKAEQALQLLRDIKGTITDDVWDTIITQLIMSAASIMDQKTSRAIAAMGAKPQSRVKNYTIIKEYYSAFVEASNIQQKTEAIAFVSDVLKAVRSDKTFANAKYVIKNCESFLKKMNDLSFLQKKQ